MPNCQFQENDWKLSRLELTKQMYVTTVNIICCATREFSFKSCDWYPLDIIHISLTLSPESPFADNLELGTFLTLWLMVSSDRTSSLSTSFVNVLPKIFWFYLNIHFLLIVHKEIFIILKIRFKICNITFHYSWELNWERFGWDKGQISILIPVFLFFFAQLLF